MQITVYATGNRLFLNHDPHQNRIGRMVNCYLMRIKFTFWNQLEFKDSICTNSQRFHSTSWILKQHISEKETKNEEARLRYRSLSTTGVSCWL